MKANETIIEGIGWALFVIIMMGVCILIPISMINGAGIIDKIALYFLAAVLSAMTVCLVIIIIKDTISNYRYEQKKEQKPFRSFKGQFGWRIITDDNGNEIGREAL